MLEKLYCNLCGSIEKANIIWKNKCNDCGLRICKKCTNTTNKNFCKICCSL